jgi:hypothetical protein
MHVETDEFDDVNENLSELKIQNVLSHDNSDLRSVSSRSSKLAPMLIYFDNFFSEYKLSTLSIRIINPPYEDEACLCDHPCDENI